ncbi:glycerophosphodiester phosphodiesterase [Phycicoccus endophyticus]|uniref:glycerophosphodiester phosphodiesterase n=1 Tax=Phycicoccus endophyticus TaxID=1690220 RepID=A0A7G9R3Z5_9MICO|nr:glycerophosphodiester phosphodiesterase [Phycicoccus endophyticus]NHI18159.1 glycerophosphodiester phosphodiesterase [Phycicoccus endophyticus]QNN50320.1 glycerophosphodiester phosphodiesterase [Phycicoccus endophyticus]GGL25986.1 glycerophosphoryl diester phosphodiesterase [Phycicoccus endophyticus]
MSTTIHRTRAVLALLALAGLVLLPSAPAAERPASTAAASAHHPGPRTSVTVYAHRGASGYRPEHTRGAYELAAALGADYLEPDLVMTRDGVLVDRHEPEISGTTDVAAHPEFAGRRTTKMLDGRPVTGWFVEDFTLAELRTLRAVERLPELRQHNTLYDGLWQVPTFEETLRWRAELSRREGRTIGIIPEIKHSTYLHAQGLDPERALVRLVTRYGLNHRGAPLWVQSFEWTSLQRLRTRLGYRADLVFLASGSGGPYDLAAAGHPRSYAELLEPASLRRLARVVDGVAPTKELVIPRTATGALGSPTTLVRDAHRAGLEVTIWTMRAENEFLPSDLRVGLDPAAYGRAFAEDLAYLRAGVDGMFCDQPDICVQAREMARRAAA